MSTLTLSDAVSDYLTADFDGMTDAEAAQPLAAVYKMLERDHGGSLQFTFEQFAEQFFAVRRREGIAPVV